MLKHSIDIAQKPLFFEKCQFSTLRRSANEYVIYKDEITDNCSIAVIFYVTFAKLAKSLKSPAYNKRNPALSHDKTGLKAIRKEKINRFSPGLIYVHPLPGNNIYRPA